jgi:leader peptidase (prepilin peptidase)/N-methyltransferase
MTEPVIQADTDTPVLKVAPWHIFMQMKVWGRVLTGVGLVIAVVSITYFNVVSNSNPFEALSAYTTVLFLLWLAAIDAKTFRLPNEILATWLTLRALFILGISLYNGNLYTLIESLLGAVSMLIIFLIIYFISKRSLGGGDVKLSFVLGLALTQALVFTAVFYGLLFCGIFALIAVLTKKLKRKDNLPLGPCIFIGTIIAYVLHVW